MPFIPDSGLQQLINQSAQSAQTGVASAFDTAYSLRLHEQQKAKELYETLTKANPQLGALVASQSPDLIIALTKTPPLNEKGPAKQGPTAPGGKGPGTAPPT